MIHLHDPHDPYDPYDHCDPCDPYDPYDPCDPCDHKDGNSLGHHGHLLGRFSTTQVIQVKGRSMTRGSDSAGLAEPITAQD